MNSNAGLAEDSKISVLIVGAGVAGLAAALECTRYGHNVRIIEKAPSRLLSGILYQTVPTIIIRHSFANAVPL